ncbi:MAG: uL15m family ribosomal protein [archaeon]
MAADRKRRKKNKLRGQRTMGNGGTKNRRGAGCRGGRGASGANKHNFHTIGRLKPRKYRFKVIFPKLKEIKLGELDTIIDSLVTMGKVKKEGETYIVDKRSGFGKVLAQGETKKVIILRVNASKDAIKKIIVAGGKFEYKKKDFDAEDVQKQIEDEDLEFESVEGDKE